MHIVDCDNTHLNELIIINYQDQIKIFYMLILSRGFWSLKKLCLVEMSEAIDFEIECTSEKYLNKNIF